jgi:hypothetical protein
MSAELYSSTDILDNGGGGGVTLATSLEIIVAIEDVRGEECHHKELAWVSSSSLLHLSPSLIHTVHTFPRLMRGQILYMSGGGGIPNLRYIDQVHQQY